MIESNADTVIKRLKDLIKRSRPDSPELRQALTRIGAVVSSEAIINVRRHNLIDTGNLMNSIRYEFFSKQNKPGIRIGSFGVPYASVHEFGFQGSVSIRAHTRLMTKAFGRDVSPRKVDIAPHQRLMRVREKPFLRPAVRKHREMIIDQLRGALNG